MGGGGKPTRIASNIPIAAHACTLQAAKLPHKKWQRVAVIRPLFLWRIFRGGAGAGSLEGILNKLLC
jgi:hypothetical protein